MLRINLKIILQDRDSNPKPTVWERCCLNKNFTHKKGMSLFYVDFFCLTVPKNFVGELFSVSLFSGIEKVWIKWGGGVSRFSVEFFLSHSAENFRRGIPYCCINFGYRKSFEKRGYQDFMSKIFCLTVPKIFVGESFTVALTSGTEKSLDKRGGEYQDFLSKIFRLTVPKISVGESFTVVLISDCEKVYGQEGRGEYQDFPSKIFFLTVPKKFVGESFSNSKNWGIEKCYG